MATVQTIAGDNGAGGTTIARTITSSTAGNCLIAVIGILGKNVTGVTDNLGQTWIQAATPGTNTEHPAFWYFPNTASGVTTVTATFSASFPSVIFVHEESGLATSSTKDKDAFSTSASSTTWDTTATASTTQADEIAFAAVASSSGSSRSFALDGTSSGAGWAVTSGTGITSGHHGNTTDGNDLFLARRVLSATGTYNCSGTCTSSIRAAAIVTFKVAASAAFNPLNGRRFQPL